MLKHIRDVGAESVYNGGRCQLVNLPAPSTIFRSYPSEIGFAPHWHEFHRAGIQRGPDSGIYATKTADKSATLRQARLHYDLFAISKVLPTVPKIRLSCIFCTWFPLRLSVDRGHSSRCKGGREESKGGRWFQNDLKIFWLYP